MSRLSSDMLSLSLLALLAAQTGEPFLRHPDIHGNQILFTSEGDIWVGDLKSGEAHRLTSDAGVERNASFSPDGSQIAFEGMYDGDRQAYVMPASGGVPKRITSVEGFRGVTGWTPDGKNVLIRFTGTPTSATYATVPASGGVPTRLPLEFAAHVWFGPDSNHYAFTRFNRWSTAWFHYIGGMQNQIWVRNPNHRPGDREYLQLTEVDGTNEYPVWCGDRIYFVNEKQAKFTLMSIPATGGKVRTELPPSEVEIRELATDGKQLIFEKGSGVEVFNSGDKAATPVRMRLETDLIHARPFQVDAEAAFSDVVLTSTGKRVLVEARGQILTIPVGDGEARVWKAVAGVRFRHPAMSADNKHVAYVSDATGEQQVYIANADGTGEKQLTKDKDREIWGVRFSPDGNWVAFTDSHANVRIVNAASGEEKTVAYIPFTWYGAPFDFSPDSKWIAYSQVIPGTLFNAIELYEVATGKTTRITDGKGTDQFPSFTPDGKFLAYVTNRSITVAADPVQSQLNTKPMGIITLLALRKDVEDPFALKDPEEGAAKPDEKKKDFSIDLDGLNDRRIELPAPPANITLPPGSDTAMAATATRFLYLEDGTLKFFDMASKTAGELGPATTFSVAADHQTVLTISGKTLTVMNEKGEAKKAPAFGGLKLRVEPISEWKQIFWDSWRHLRDYFYMPNMNGLDWQAIGDKYAKMLPSVRSRDELDELMRWLQCEIGSSHQYLQPGDLQDIKPKTAPAFLGVDLAADSSGFFRIRRLYRGDGFRPTERSPLLGVGKDVREGMFLVEVNGEPVKVGEDPYANLRGRAGKVVSVKVNTKPSLEGATSVLVKPVASELRMRYLDWVQANRDYVTRASDGKLGYLHLSAMGINDMQDFIRQYYGQRDKDGFIIDDRFNGGGFVQDYINKILNESLTAFFNQRDSNQFWTRQADFFSGPMVTLINEFDISCGEEFPHRFKDLKRGPLIGRRTMGGEIGSDPGWPLIDGGRISVPNYGMFTIDGGWAIEGKGVEPDIDVPSDPNAFILGRDPQLDRAVEYLLGELKKKPPVRAKLPPPRDRVHGG